MTTPWSPAREQQVLEHGLEALRELLGPEWEVTPRPDSREAGVGDRRIDAVVEVRPPGGNAYAELLVEVKSRVTPKDVDVVLLPMADLMRRMNASPSLLVISPWISPRTQQVLREHGIGYMDLTGNAWLRVSTPAIVIHTQGASRAPQAAAVPRTDKPQLSGPKAGRLVRLLADVAPPYRASDLAQAARLSLPYVSRLLDSLDDQLLIRRAGRLITDVDWSNLLRLRAEQLILLKHNPYVGAIAPNGIKTLQTQLKLRNRIVGHEVALTGSYAARTIAPVAVGGQMMLYVPHTPHAPDEVIRALGLLRVEEGAEVLLLRAHDNVVFQRTTEVDGIRQVALSQLVLDCLSGPGRMPAEGEAVLQHMAEQEHTWRVPGIPQLPDDALF